MSNKLTPSINYFYDVLFWLCKQKGIIGTAKYVMIISACKS